MMHKNEMIWCGLVGHGWSQGIEDLTSCMNMKKVKCEDCVKCEVFCIQQKFVQIEDLIVQAIMVLIYMMVRSEFYMHRIVVEVSQLAEPYSRDYRCNSFLTKNLANILTRAPGASG